MTFKLAGAASKGNRSGTKTTGNYLTQAYVLLGNGDGTFGAPARFGSANQPLSLAVADFDGDGSTQAPLADFNNQAR
jgi:hypothetical protein